MNYVINKIRSVALAILGKARYSLLTEVARDAILLFGIALIVYLTTKGLSAILPAEDAQFAFLRRAIEYSHEAAIVLGLFAIVVRVIKHLWKWIHT